MRLEMGTFPVTDVVFGGATRSRCPARMYPFAGSAFQRRRSRWVTPYSSAMPESVSPRRTLW